MATVLIGGGTGLIGTRLTQLLLESGYKVAILSRSAKNNSNVQYFQWDLKANTIDTQAIETADYIINLTGAGIADARWTESRKQLIINSRIQSNELLLKYALQKSTPIKAFVAASAIGYYGDTGNQTVTEETKPALNGFLSESVVAWEKSIEAIIKSPIRGVGIRIGLVLSTQGGALQKMLLPTNFLINGYFGDGQQWYAWVHIDDICRLFIHALEQDKMEGFYNGTAPNPVTNKVLSQALGDNLNKPTLLLPVPSFALRLGMGEMADVVLTSAKVLPKHTLTTGFDFNFKTIDSALADILKRKV